MDLVSSFLKMLADGSGLIAGDGPDGGLGLVMSGLAGIAAALAVALILAVYFRTGYRSARDVLRHGLAATAVLGLLAFVAYDVGHAALAYLGINPSKPEAGFEIRPPKTSAFALAVIQVERDT
jgi:high-affinity Fe2+/Pb2+ permease